MNARALAGMNLDIIHASSAAQPAKHARKDNDIEVVRIALGTSSGKDSRNLPAIEVNAG